MYIEINVLKQLSNIVEKYVSNTGTTATVDVVV